MSFFQVFVYLLAAVISVPLAKRLGLGSVLGYLLAGIVIGPFGLRLVGSAHGDVMHIAEFGVVMCSFWFVECLSRAGDLERARFFFEKALGYANHLGLYAEELGPSGEHLGNFPQAFTHLALISAAYNLDRELSVARE